MFTYDINVLCDNVSCKHKPCFTAETSDRADPFEAIKQAYRFGWSYKMFALDPKVLCPECTKLHPSELTFLIS